MHHQHQTHQSFRLDHVHVNIKNLHASITRRYIYVLTRAATGATDRVVKAVTALLEAATKRPATDDIVTRIS